jgi:hypothetical protein
MIDLLRGHFTAAHLDLAPFAGSIPGAFIVQASPESIAVLKRLLESKHE